MVRSANSSSSAESIGADSEYANDKEADDGGDDYEDDDENDDEK